MSEVLGFSASNTRAVKVTASQTSSPFSQITLGTFFIPAFSLLCLFLWLLLACWASFLRLGVGVGFFKVFSGVLLCFGCVRVSVAPYTFCGLPILLWGRVKVWDGYAGDV